MSVIKGGIGPEGVDPNDSSSQYSIGGYATLRGLFPNLAPQFAPSSSRVFAEENCSDLLPGYLLFDPLPVKEEASGRDRDNQHFYVAPRIPPRFPSSSLQLEQHRQEVEVDAPFKQKQCHSWLQSVNTRFNQKGAMFDRTTGNGNGNKMNVRLNVLEGLLHSMEGEGTTAKANALRHAIRRNKCDMADTARESLDIMRRIFQAEMTNELREIIDRHMRTTFSPAIENLRRNGHKVGEAELNALSRSVLEAAKEPFGGRSAISRKRAGRDPDLDTDLEDDGPQPAKRRFESEDESDGSVLSFTTLTEKKRRRPRSKKDEEAILNDTSTITLADTMKWNPERFCPSSRVLFASRVAATLNIPVSLFFNKYPRFFRYVCDEEDKNELYDGGRLSRLTGRAVLVLLDDAFEILGHSPEIERYSFPIGESIYGRLRQRCQRVYDNLCQRLADSTAASINSAAAALFPFVQSPVMSFSVS